MKCPNCDKTIPEGSKICDNCGVDITKIPGYEEEHTETAKPKKRKINFSDKGIKIAIIVVAALIVAIVVLVIILLFGKSEGEKTADLLFSNIGSSVARAEDETGIPLNLESRFDYLSEYREFQFVSESDKTVVVNGMHLPEWAIYISHDDNQKISEVAYCNYSMLSANSKGVKLSEPIAESTVDYAMKMKDVKKAMPIEPIAIVQNDKELTVYYYRYYTIDKTTKNEVGYLITIEYYLGDQVTKIVWERNRNGIEDVRF